MLVPGELLTEGKGKRIYATEDPDKAIVYFKDEAMAYHGLKRGRILGKGEINNAICKHIFELLAAHGVENHFIQQLDARQSLVKRVEILPLEIKVRNIVAGSLSRRIGYPVGTRLPSTVLEFVLKNDELENPLVNFSHILAMGLATRAELEEISRISLEVNRILANCWWRMKSPRIPAASGTRRPTSPWILTGSGGTWAMWSRLTRKCSTA